MKNFIAALAIVAAAVGGSSNLPPIDPAPAPPTTLELCDHLLNIYLAMDRTFYYGYYDLDNGSAWRCVVIADAWGEAYVTATIYLDRDSKKELLRRIILEEVGLDR